jgi:hypothetical protein
MAMNTHSRWLLSAIAALCLAAQAPADVIAVGPDAFPASATLLDFRTLPLGTEVNGLTVSGVQFTYSIGAAPRNGIVRIDEGPGITNHITIPNILSVGDNTGTLTVRLPVAASLFGYGFAILNEFSVADATRIAALNGSTPVGTLTFNGAPDPIFTGGFAALRSTTPFDRLELTFNSIDAPAFALDNIAFATPVPEPSTVPLALMGLGAAIVLIRRSKGLA